jgi:type IV pilus assembly protein PilM
MFGFGRKRSELLGLDISSTAIKLIELSRSPHPGDALYQVESYAVEALPVNAVVEKKIAEVQVVAETMRRAVSHSGTKNRRAAVAVSGSVVITKIIPMSASLSDAEMEAQIQLEADQYIPFALEEVNIDFDVIGPSDSGSEMVDVLLAASRRENVDDRVSALELAGLHAEIVDVEAYVMENAYYSLLVRDPMEQPPERTVAIADVGATTTSLHVLHDGHTVYTREQNFGGQQLIEELQRRYALTRERALREVIAGDLPENYMVEVLGPFKEALAQQIGRALQFFYSAGSAGRVDHLILAGGSAGIADIDELVKERLGISTMVANPFSRMSLSPRIDPRLLERDAPALVIAAGLSLRGFD